MITSLLTDAVLRLKEDRNAIILAHNYQRQEVQDIADFVGDSLALCQKAVDSKADVIVFCGVHFMAETAAILCPDKKVLLPDPNAGCSLANTIEARHVQEWKSRNPEGVVVAYVNTSAAVKAVADICCTSSNAVEVVNSIPANKEILFVPDQYLGEFVQKKTGRHLQIWPGSCHVHAKITAEYIDYMRQKFPEAEMLVHPECSGVLLAIKEGAFVTSTNGMIRRVQESPAQEFLVATETGILHALRKRDSKKAYIPIHKAAICEFMKMTTLEKVRDSLLNMRVLITVPPNIAEPAKRALDKMMAISKPAKVAGRS